jgi:hypothetical protein
MSNRIDIPRIERFLQLLDTRASVADLIRFLPPGSYALTNGGFRWIPQGHLRDFDPPRNRVQIEVNVTNGDFFVSLPGVSGTRAHLHLYGISLTSDHSDRHLASPLVFYLGSAVVILSAIRNRPLRVPRPAIAVGSNEDSQSWRSARQASMDEQQGYPQRIGTTNARMPSLTGSNTAEPEGDYGQNHPPNSKSVVAGSRSGGQSDLVVGQAGQVEEQGSVAPVGSVGQVNSNRETASPPNPRARHHLPDNAPGSTISSSVPSFQLRWRA